MTKSINLGIIGLGGRGYGLLKSEILRMKDVNIAGVCDSYQDRAERGLQAVKKAKGYTPVCSTNYKDILSIKEIDGIMITTSWEDHINIAIECMEKGIFVAMEVGGAYSIEDCWRLVNTYERTGTPCMLLENCCYGKMELALLNMVRMGIFGDIVHCAGGYLHDLRYEISNGIKNRHYRLRNYIERNCENYPTHELGPIAKLLDINRGNRMLTLSSFSSKSRGLHEYIEKYHKDDKELMDTVFKQGDIVTTVINCERGETIVLTLDTTLPRPYSRGLYIKGTKGMYQEDGNFFYMDNKLSHKIKHDRQNALWGNATRFIRKYKHPLWKTEKKLTGHGGMDTLVLRAMVDSIRTKSLPPIDVYDTASWMAITALSEQSIKGGGILIEIPDFTSGNYKDRKDISESKFSLDINKTNK